MIKSSRESLMFWSQNYFFFGGSGGGAVPCGLQDWLPNPRIKLGSSVVEMQIPNHWTAEASPNLFQ